MSFTLNGPFGPGYALVGAGAPYAHAAGGLRRPSPGRPRTAAVNARAERRDDGPIGLAGLPLAFLLSAGLWAAIGGIAAAVASAF